MLFVIHQINNNNQIFIIMNLLENKISYRPSIKPTESRSKDEKLIRVFGKNITNIDKNIIKNNIFINNKTQRSLQFNRNRANSLNTNLKPVQKEILKQYHDELMNSLVIKDQKSQRAKQCQITEKMRAILIDWLIDVHYSFQLSEQTLHLCFKYFQDYCSKQQITKSELQLVGITCLWIASKFQQIYPPRMNHFVEITADTYTMDQMRAMQGKIIQNLGFNLVKTTSFQLLQIALGTKMGQQTGSICKYIIQMAMLNNIISDQKPSIVTIAAIQVADCILHEKNNLSKFKETFNPDNDDTKSLFKEMCNLLQGGGRKDNLKAIKKKYLSQKLHQVSRIYFQLK